MNTTSKLLSGFLIGLILILSVCTSRPSELKDNLDEEFEDAKEIKDEVVAYFLGISHQVADLETWKLAFNADEQIRRENGIELLEILVDNDVENSIMAVFKVESKDKASGYIYSDELKMTMERAGVISKPEIRMWDIIDLSDIENLSSFSDWLMVTHRIKNYEVWKKDFDENQDIRVEYGITTIGIGRDNARPNQISVMFGCDDTEKAVEFANSEELRNEMDEAGVISRPEIRFYKVLQ